MLVKSIFAVVAAASTVVAATPDTFRLRILKPGTEVHHGEVTASWGSPAIDGPQKVNCAGNKDPSAATFKLVGDKLFLYNGNQGRKPQQFYTDRSGMGRGVVQYLDHPATLPEDFQTKGFRVDSNGLLKFETDGFYACPGAKKGVHTLWLSKAFKECFSVKVKVVDVENPVACTYKGGH